MVFFELQFLPYHHEVITWWQRIVVLLDLILLWLLWPSIMRGERARLALRDFRRWKILALVLASLAPVLLVNTIATIPDEWPQSYLPLASIRELLFAEDVDFVARKPKSLFLWSNVLVLPGFDAIDHTKFDSEAKIEAASQTLSLRGRHLEGAVLIGASLRKADFTGARLQGAQFSKSDLRGAKLDCPDMRDTQECAQLQHAMFLYANLQEASLAGANLHEASFLARPPAGAR